MKIIIIATMLLAGLYSVAGAQEASPSPTPAPTEAPAPVAAPAAPAPAVAPAIGLKFYLEVDTNDLQAISQALNELPKRVADPLILKLNAQLQNQQSILASKSKVDSSGAVVDAEKPKKGKK